MASKSWASHRIRKPAQAPRAHVAQITGQPSRTGSGISGRGN